MESEEEEESIVDKVGSLLLIACGIVLLLLTLSLFKVFKKKITIIRRWYYKIYYALFWNGIIVYILESYQGVTLVNLQFLFSGDINWKNPIQVIFGVISIMTLTVYLVTPILMTIFFRSKVHKFHLTTFKLRYSEAINDLNQKGNSSPNYFMIFCFRRLAANLLVVLLPLYSSSQIMLYVF